MNRIIISGLLILLFFQDNLNAQKQYVTSLYITFSESSEKYFTPVSLDCGHSDIVLSVDKNETVMQVDVEKVCASWAMMQHWMGNPYAMSLVFNKRYIEFRVKSTEAHKNLGIGFQVSGGSPNGSIGKSIPNVSYSITEANKWETKFINVGGDADTIFKEIDWLFDNGTYYFEYIKLGDAAVPSKPTIHPIADQQYSEGIPNYLLLSGITTSNGKHDGIKLYATSKLGMINLSFMSLGDNIIDESNNTAFLICKPYKGYTGKKDTVTVVVADTIRGTQVSTSFEVSIIKSFKVAGSIKADNEKARNSTVYLLNNLPYFNTSIDTTIAVDGNYSFMVGADGSYSIYAVPSEEYSEIYRSTYLGDVSDIDKAFVIHAQNETGNLNIRLLKKSESDRVSEKKDEVSIYPNPTTGIFNITGNGLSRYQVDIIDLYSNVLYQNKAIENNQSIDASFLTDGIYMIVLTNQQGERRRTKLQITK